MELVPYVVAYIAIGIFVVAVVARFLYWRRLPIHVRWELYPVAHDRRASYGGSYLEETEWWRKPRVRSLAGELKAMALEILFLVALREHNRRLWLRSFPFHFGLYLVIATTVLMLGSGLLAAVAPSLIAGGLGRLLQYAVIACGAAGLVLGLAGALGLLERRLADPTLRDVTAAGDIFNLLFFVVAFGTALASFLAVDRDFGRALHFVHGLVAFRMAALPGEGLALYLPTASVVLLGALVAYIPLTHMSHFVGKFFAYHAIRWNDEPNLRGGHEEAAIQKLLAQPVSWAAPHIGADGKKTWVDVATEDLRR
jgi:nitrate reductase gamma subunit